MSVHFPTNEAPGEGAEWAQRYRRRYLWCAMSIHLGEYMAMMITSYLVFHRTHSVTLTGLILVSYNAPALLLATRATSLSHRYGAARVDAWVNLSEALITLVPMVLGFTHHLTLLSLFLWVVAYGSCEGLNSPNSFLIRQSVAAPGRLPELNSAYTRNVAISAALGMLLGGGIFTLAGPGYVFLVCAVTAIPEISLFFRMAHDVTGPPRHASGSDTVREAVRLLRTEPGLWAACRFAILCFFIAGYAVTLPAIANAVGSNAENLSLLESGSLVGGILVAVVVRRIHGRVSWGHIQRACYFAAAAGLAAMALVDHSYGAHSRVLSTLIVLTTIPVSFTVLLNVSIVTSVIQIGTPPEQRASMFTLLALVPLVVGPVSQEVVGYLADRLSVALALGVVAFITVVVYTVMSHRPMSRHFDTLNAMAQPFPVNEMTSHRGGHRGHAHSHHWPDAL
jgi:hypothetical protein